MIYLLCIILALQVIEIFIFIMYIMKQQKSTFVEETKLTAKRKLKYDIANLLDPITPVEQKLDKILTDTAKKYESEIDY